MAGSAVGALNVTQEREPLPVLQANTACPQLTATAELPIRLLLVAQRSVLDTSSLSEFHADSPDLSSQIVLDEVSYEEFAELGRRFPAARYDLVYWFMQAPPAPGVVSPLDVLMTWRKGLSRMRSRLWIIDQMGDEGVRPDVRAWACALTEGGGPSVVALPGEWTVEHRLGFHRSLQRKLLTGLRLSEATWQAYHDAGSERPPHLYLPSNGDTGLNLGALLEELRRRASELESLLRSFERRLEADVPDQPSLGFDAWKRLTEAVPTSLGRLLGVTERLARAAGERSPAAWLSLADDQALLAELEQELEDARETLDIALASPLEEPVITRDHPVISEPSLTDIE